MIANGKYTLRSSPVAGVGGMFATGNGVDEIVTVAAQVPSTFGRQTWKIHAVEGKEDTYTIVLHTDGSTFGGSWSLKDNSAVPQGPVITSIESVEWIIIAANNGIPGTVFIRPTTHGVDVVYYVGTDDENNVVIKGFPVVGPPHNDIPYWQL